MQRQQRSQLAGRWKSNDATTATPPASPDDLNAHPATLYGPAAISQDSAVGAGALALDGSTAAYAATGGLQFGRRLVGRNWVQPFSGQLDDMWAYQGVLTQAQVISLSLPEELDSTAGS